MPLLEMRQISKSYHGVPVLREVDLEAEGGEVHALVGENGAGKSTLMKILDGAVRADQGSIRLGGELVDIPSPRAAQQLGVDVIHQELLLAPSLDAAENIFLGRTPSRGRVFVDRRTLYQRAEAVLAELGADLDVRVPLRRLTVAQRQMVAIARALSAEARIVVMDEPSAVLTRNELERLFEAIGRLCARGVAVVYISHRLDEVFRLAARVTVLKDGQSQGTYPIGELTRAKVIRLMQTGLPAASSMRISHTWVLRPTCSGRAVPVTRPLRTARRWFALISNPTTASPRAASMPALLPRVSASATEAPPCNSPYG